MADLGDIKHRLGQILSEAQAQGYKLDDVVPKEMLNHFPDKEELRAAQKLIRELKGRESTLQAANEALLAALKEKEEELTNQPDDLQALRVDLKQALRHVDYYKQLADDSQRRADRYKQSMVEATKDQLVASELAARNEKLQSELFHYESAMRQLQDESQRNAEIFARLRAEDKKAMAANEAKLAAMQSHASRVEKESEAFSEAFTNLIDTLESENSTAASLINDKGVVVRKMEVLYNVVVSEVAPLKRFFGHTSHMLQMYQDLFQTLSDPCRTSIARLPRHLDRLISGASDDLYAYHEIHNVLSGAGGVAEDQIRVELNGMSKSADDMLESLCCIKRDVENFLARLRAEPGTWLAMKARFGGNKMKKRLVTN